MVPNCLDCILNICFQDFALDPDENRLRRACHHMMRALTAGMASITGRDPLAGVLLERLKDNFKSSMRGAINNPEQMKRIEEASMQLTQDNVELATNFIVKTACEKAAPEIDTRLDAEIQMRAQARRENRTYTDAAALQRAQ